MKVHKRQIKEALQGWRTWIDRLKSEVAWAEEQESKLWDLLLEQTGDPPSAPVSDICGQPEVASSGQTFGVRSRPPCAIDEVEVLDDLLFVPSDLDVGSPLRNETEAGLKTVPQRPARMLMTEMRPLVDAVSEAARVVVRLGGRANRREVAKHLGISENAAGRRLKRGVDAGKLAHLRRGLYGMFVESGSPDSREDAKGHVP